MSGRNSNRNSQNNNRNSRQLAQTIMSWMTDPDFEEIDTGTAPPRGPIRAPRPAPPGGWLTNPVIVKTPKNPKQPKGPKKPKKPNNFAR